MSTVESAPISSSQADAGTGVANDVVSDANGSAKEAPSSVASRPFEADVQRVLRLVIDSLYSQREVFVRELISNACDALDKRRVDALTEGERYRDAGAPEIRVHFDTKARTLSIADNGIGMDAIELAENLGRIAHSGTRMLSEELAARNASEVGAGAESPTAELIGRFGVGFYSVFLVAKAVEVLSRPARDRQAHIWRSDGLSGYSIEEARRVEPGTTVTLALKDDAGFEPADLRAAILRFADALPHPILLSQDEEAPTQLNRAEALWRKSPREVNAETHAAFFANLSPGAGAPLHTLHVHIEGTQVFYALVYIPERGQSLFGGEPKSRMRLYAQRVPVIEACEALLPPWLRFCVGIVDSEDLPLNVSRELLQDERVVTRIRTQLTKQLVSGLKKLAQDDPDRFAQVWAAHGTVIKEGFHLDAGYAKELESLLHYETLLSEKPISLASYVEAMSEQQPAIYYALGDNAHLLRSRPELEAFKEAGQDVLLATCPIDPWVMAALPRFDDKPLKSAFDADAAPLVDNDVPAGDDAWIKGLRLALQDNVAGVEYSKRLRQAPACLKRDEDALPAHVRRALEAMGQRVPETKATLEVNATHPLVAKLRACAAENAEPETLKSWGEVLLGLATLSEGELPADPAAFARVLASQLAGS